ncbi:Sec-independent protein translocase subunit TatA [Streptomyces gamaensis]|uniref:Sec-independent protein translocase protein TatA n=1 Tax=Streptomyces gamaensis TaxID=1763542 RepID=A0ABW0Z6G4_9ACTN
MWLRNGLEPWHLLVLALVVLVVFGSKRLPDTARALGKSLRILKSETRAMKDEGASTAQTGQEPARETPAVHRIQAAPGDAASSRPAQENSTAPGGPAAH